MLLVGAVVASEGCHSRHDWALSRSGLAVLARASLLACVVGSAGAASGSMPCGQGLARPRLLGVGVAVSGVGGGKEMLVDGGMGRAAVVAAAGPVGLWLGRPRSQGLGWPPCGWWVRWRCLAAVTRRDWALG